MPRVPITLRSSGLTTDVEVSNLDDLLALMNDEGVEFDSNVMTSLPTFGGEEPKDTAGIWSWDETRLLAGDDEIEIVSREDYCGE